VSQKPLTTQQGQLQLERIVASVKRLTLGTVFDGTVVQPEVSEDSERLKFSAITPNGGPLFNFYTGILIHAVEGWTDESLDHRLYESSEPIFRHVLNKPDGISSVASEVDGSCESGFTGCQVCHEIALVINSRLACLDEISGRATRLSVDRSLENSDELSCLLKWHPKVHEELQRLQSALSIHLQSHHSSV
jgi:hypothetical protein